MFSEDITMDDLSERYPPGVAEYIMGEIEKAKARNASLVSDPMCDQEYSKTLLVA